MQTVKIVRPVNIDGVDYSPDALLVLDYTRAGAVIGSGHAVDGTDDPAADTAVEHDPFPQYLTDDEAAERVNAESIAWTMTGPVSDKESSHFYVNGAYTVLDVTTSLTNYTSGTPTVDLYKNGSEFITQVSVDALYTSTVVAGWTLAAGDYLNLFVTANGAIADNLVVTLRLRRDA